MLSDSFRVFAVIRADHMDARDQSSAERIQKLRKEYQNDQTLTEALVKPDPYLQFGHWFDAAVQAGLDEPNAMTLATAGSDGRPSARIVLMKEFSAAGFVFYSNYRSKKGEHLAVNNHAALLFFWGAIERQVRIEGSVSKISRQQSESYFQSRPRGAQLSAAASEQSTVIAGRSVLERRHAELDAAFAQTPVRCPGEWGGYLVSADYFEFWQGRENRLHDRIAYQREGVSWRVERLSP